MDGALTGRCPLMRWLHRHSSETAPDTRDDQQRRDPVEGAPTLERWDRVESPWNLGSVVVLLAGAALVVVGLVGAVRTGINSTWYRPVEEVAGVRHTPLLAAIEAGVGVLLGVSPPFGPPGWASVVCV